MKITNGWSVAVFASITLILAACSANPVEDENTVPKTKVATKSAFKATVATPAKQEKKATAAKTIVATKPALTQAQSLAKKKKIAALGKSKREQAKIKLAQAKARQQYLKNQELKKIALKRRQAQKSITVARAANQRRIPNNLGLDRFSGSQGDTVVSTRSPQPVATRSVQPVVTRAKQPVRTRAPIKLARAVAPKRVALPKPPVLRKPRPRVQKVAFNRNIKRPTPRVARIDPNNSFGYALSNAAIERTKHRVRYDGKYLKIGYPWGDVPKSIGVCTDVVIRAYRRLGIDLQSEVHKDISQDFYAYPNLVKWGLNRPDPNIDHRRVYNLQAFFKRHKAELPRSRNPRDYKPGDLVTWMVGPNFPHIGVVVNRPSKADPKRLMIAHNIGAGPQIEDILFRFPMTGHYRYTPKNKAINPSLLFAKTPAPAHVIKKQRRNSLSYAELLQASKILSGQVQARSLPKTRSDLLTKNTSAKKGQEKIMLAHLDAGGIDQAALQALLK